MPQKHTAGKRFVSIDSQDDQAAATCTVCCPYCEFAAASKHEFYAHLRTAHQPSGKCKLHACPFCPYTTIRIADMKRHLGTCKRKKHANANGVHMTTFKTKSRVCLKCSYTTVRKGDMNRHIRMKHEKWRPFKCQHCHQSFSYMRDLNSHLKSQHGQSAYGDDNTAADAAAAASDSSCCAADILVSKSVILAYKTQTL